MTTHCRYCKLDLDDGDIYEVLSADSYYKNYSQDDLIKAAGTYGWTVENKKRFSKIKTIHSDDSGYFIEICPACNGLAPLEINKPKVYFTG